MMRETTTALLLVEDNPGDAHLLGEMLGERGVNSSRLTHVNCMGDAERFLAGHAVDVILLDLGLPDAQGLEAVRRVQAAAPNIPLVVLTGLDDEALATKALQEGAQDYLVKGQIDPHGLERALRYAIERNVAEVALRGSERQYRQLVHGLAVAVYTTDAEGCLTLYNQAAADLWGREPELGRDRWCGSTRLLSPDGVPIAPGQYPMAVSIRTGTVVSGQEVLVERADGSRRQILQHPALLRDASGAMVGAVNLLVDITERTRAEDGVRRLNRVYAVLSGIDALIIRVPDQRELFREACRIAVETGRFALAYVYIVDPLEQRLKVAAVAGADAGFLDGIEGRMSLRDDSPDGFGPSAVAAREKRAVIVNDIGLDDGIRQKQAHLDRGIRSLVALPLVVGGKVVGVLALHAEVEDFFDAGEMKLLVELAGHLSFALKHIEKSNKVEYLALYDSLTGLANRTLFLERLRQSVHTAGQGQAKIGVVLLDIERLHTINESLGRQAGDAVLKQVAERLAGAAGATEVGRITADQFALKFEGMKGRSETGRVVRALLRKCLGAPFSVNGTELRIAAKAGISMFPADGTEAEVLLRQAEAALRGAKETGEPHTFYTRDLTEQTSDPLTLENKLRQALEKDEFVLHYQPKVDLGSGRIVGVEALIRWQSPELGLVPPMKFIPLMEETGMILDVGAWALAKAAADHQRWTRMGLQAPRVAVNVSAIQLRKADFLAMLKEAVGYGAAPPAIDLEITESLVMQDIQGNIAKLKEVHELGMSIAIDDFGTGYSSLAYLAKLPVQTLKIDRAFVITMLNDADAMTLVRTIISLAHSLRLKVVAEGVDSEEQATTLRLLRCDQMQGYLFSKPVPFDALAMMLDKVPDAGPVIS